MSSFVTPIESPHVGAVVHQVVDRLNPHKIYLYNQRVNAAGSTTAFKLCVVCEAADKHVAEMTIYREVDSDVPFDLLLYTPEEWSRLSAKPDAFAKIIAEKGSLLYG